MHSLGENIFSGGKIFSSRKIYSQGEKIEGENIFSGRKIDLCSQVEQEDAERYAERHHMGFYEVSPLVNFNITESFQELCRMALRRNGMERLWRGRQVCVLS